MSTFKEFLTESFLAEAREDTIAQKQEEQIIAAYQKDTGRGYGHALAIVKYLAQAGPKYIQWIVNRYIDGQFRWEDIPQIKADLIKFEQLCKSNTVPNKDIGYYKSVSQLRTMLRDNSVAGEGHTGKLEKLYQGVSETIKAGHGKWIYNNPSDPVKIFVPTDETGSVAIRKAYPDISWCTTYEDDMEAIQQEYIDNLVSQRWKANTKRYSNDDQNESAYEALVALVCDEVNEGEHEDEILEFKTNLHDYYLKEYGGEYYVILTPDGPYQFHFESGQFKDQDDENIDFEDFVKKYPTVKRKLGPIVTKLGHPHFHPDVKELSSADVIKSIIVAQSNIDQVPTQYLTKQGWIDIIVGLIKKGYDNSRNISSADRDVRLTVLHMRERSKFDIDEIVDICEAAINKIPYQLSIACFPSDVVMRMDPDLGLRKIKGYKTIIGPNHQHGS